MVILETHVHYCITYVLVTKYTEYAEVPQPPEVPISALTATSANLNWSCPLEKNFTITSYSVNVTVVSPRLVDVKCLNGQNFSYYITVPGYQRYVELKNMSLSMLPVMPFVATIHLYY